MDIVRSSDGTRIAFDRIGEGPPVIIVGGAFNDRSSPAPLAELLAPSFTVFRYDRRGRGDSGDTAPYAVEREREDIEALIGEAGGAASLFGHSSGAVLALEAAARGVAVTKLVLYEAPFIVDDSRPPLPEDAVSQLRGLVATGRRGDAVEYFMTAAIGIPAEAVAGMRSEPMWTQMEALAHTLAYDVTVMADNVAGRPLPAERWASVKVPTLVMDGAESPAWQRHSAQQLAQVLPEAERRSLEGQDHGAAPEVLAPVLEEFLTR